MAQEKRSSSPKFREDVVKMVTDSSRPVAQVARGLNVGEGTLGNWVSGNVNIRFN
ncbi:MAG: transposase [Nakamurella sp.]